MNPKNVINNLPVAPLRRPLPKGERVSSSLLQQICRIGPVLILLSVASCSGSLFKVKSPSALPPLAATAARADLGSISFLAAPLLTDEETQELFESNLQLAGLLPVRIDGLPPAPGTVPPKPILTVSLVAAVFANAGPVMEAWAPAVSRPKV